MYINGPLATWFALWKIVMQESCPSLLIWPEFRQAQSSVYLPSTSFLIHLEELKAPSFLPYRKNTPGSVSSGPTLQQMGVADDTRSQTFSGQPPGAMPRDARYLRYYHKVFPLEWVWLPGIAYLCDGLFSVLPWIGWWDLRSHRLGHTGILSHDFYPRLHQFEKSTMNSGVLEGSFYGGLLQVVCWMAKCWRLQAPSGNFHCFGANADDSKHRCFLLSL